ncbi:MAG: universal stress protein [Acidaminococcus sp.]|jgi:nucleotide-binding universal stress UspA family protein|nr:universal stress protein [Acidaminococcus sp.]MCI2099571.1 universal stress protein [Acidaminococcus sp.]MCI2113656.1 universal stress protein [Acidaminococcus sp.]MCI2115739.1 universal stress protein [Acidaminococcus sp.]
MFKKILVPVDGSEPAWRALATAEDLAKTYHGDLIVLHVIQKMSMTGLVLSANNASIQTESPNVSASKIGKMIIDTAKDKLAGFTGKVEYEMEFGNPAETVIEKAKEKDASVIVIGRRGLSGVEEFLLGSVSSRVVEYSDVPVVVVK